MLSGLPLGRFAVGNADAFLEALRTGGLTGAAIGSGLGGGALGSAGLYDPMKGLVGTAVDNGLGLGAVGALGSLFGGGGKRKGLDDETWLNRTYEKVLGREPGQEGLDYWGNELSQGASRGDVRDNIMRSDEAWLNRTYKDLLGRQVGDAGRTYWGGELEGGASRESVRDNIMRSNEYKEYQQDLEDREEIRGGMPRIGGGPIWGLLGARRRGGSGSNSALSNLLAGGLAGSIFR